jgi:tripartite-type tricarboxylate transporter receptor subunit TctC
MKNLDTHYIKVRAMKSYLLVCYALLSAMTPLTSSSASAAEYPNNPIRMIISSSAGGGADYLARALGAKLTQNLGQNVIADNRPGASGIIGVELATKASPDGYTVLMAQSTAVVIASHLYKNVPYKTLRDLAPVTLVADVPDILVVNNKVPANNVKELIALMKAHPGTFNFSSSGYGAPSHLAGVVFDNMAGVKMAHVPYKGAGPAAAAVLTGEVQVMFAPVVAIMPLIKSHQVKALAVTSLRRLDSLPDLPTVAESGLPGFESSSWFGIFAPAGTSQLVIDKLYKASAAALHSADIKKLFAAQGAEPVGDTPKEFAQFIGAEDAKYQKLVKDTGVKAE